MADSSSVCMKRGILSVLVALAPTVCWGLDDACTKPDEFTIDRRCYVTDEQKNVFPYNTVVALLSSKNRIYCTGTIVQDEAEHQMYVYTAKHCTDNNKDNISDNTLAIQTQQGEQYMVSLVRSGNLNIETGASRSGDWAIYNIDDAPDNLQGTTLTTYHSGFVGGFDALVDKTPVSMSGNRGPVRHKLALGEMWSVNDFDARVVGYGALKIMNDAEIRTFREKYIEFLEENLDDAVREVYKNKNLSEAEIERKIALYRDEPQLKGLYGKNIYKNNPIVQEFISGTHTNSLSSKERSDIFKDIDNLKVSYCQLSTDGYQQGCQTWHGNSGGPIFDRDGRLMGMVTRGDSFIGGNRHASGGENSSKNNDKDSDGRPDDNIHFLRDWMDF